MNIGGEMLSASKTVPEKKKTFYLFMVFTVNCYTLLLKENNLASFKIKGMWHYSLP